MLQKLDERAAAALHGVCHVVLPRVFGILLDHRPELQRDRLRKAVVDVVERAFVDVALPLPMLAVRIERNLAVQSEPRRIDAHEPLPFRVALLGRQIRLFVHDMLEVVDHRAVRDERQRGGQVAVFELVRVGAEEALGVFPAEEFHAHRMDLARFLARVLIRHRDALAVYPVGKGVTRLVRDDLDVALGAVEVGEDERTLIHRQRVAVAAALLALGGEHVHQLLVEHRAEEFACLGGKRVVEFFALLENVLRRADGTRVAAAELQRAVRKRQRIGLADALCLLAHDGIRNRHKIFLHRKAELFDVLLENMMRYTCEVKVTDPAYSTEAIAYYITDITLSLQRINEEDNVGYGLLVPVWNFWGYRSYVSVYDHEWYTDNHFDGWKGAWPILTINAITGAVIDPIRVIERKESDMKRIAILLSALLRTRRDGSTVVE